MPHIGPIELVVVLVLALLILGPQRLPSAGRSFGLGMREFKDAVTGRRSASHADTRALATTADGDAPPTEQTPY